MKRELVEILEEYGPDGTLIRREINGMPVSFDIGGMTPGIIFWKKVVSLEEVKEIYGYKKVGTIGK